MILIGLGANLDSSYGSPQDTLDSCRSLLAERGVHMVKSSNIWRSAPVPVSDQPWYYNAVCIVETSLSSHEVLDVLSSVEDLIGRKRMERNAARVIDLDLLSYNNETLDYSYLIIPHPRMHERAFVLYPLREVAPDWIHPTLGQSLSDMIVSIPKGQDIECIEGSSLLSVV